MRLIFAFVFVFNTLYSVAADLTVSELRAMYYMALTDKGPADKFMTIIDEANAESKPILLCYKGMACMLKVRYSLNPYSKYTQFQKGVTLLEDAVQKDVNNAEIRFMRYCVETNAPFFLGYNDDIESDRAFLLKSYSTIPDPDLKRKIKDYVLTGKSES